MLQSHPKTWLHPYGSLLLARRTVFLGWALVLSLALVGCRGAFSPFSPLRQEPSFDRLLDLESASGPDGTRSHAASQATTSDDPAVHPQVAQRRPGRRSAAARYADEMQVEQAAFSPPGPPTQKPIDGAGIARRAISDEVEEELSDEPDEHSNLLHQTQTALKNRYVNPSSTSTNTDDGSSVAIRLSDAKSQDIQIPVAQTAEAATLRETAPLSAADKSVVPASHRTISASSDASVQPATNNRYRQVQDAPDLVLPTEDISSTPAGSHSEADLRWEQHIEQAIKQLSQAPPSDSPSLNSREAARQAVIQRLLALAVGDRELMTSAMEGLQPQEQEYFKYQLTALVDAIDPDANPVGSRRWSLVMLNQRKAHEHLASLSNLEVSNLSFCTQVESFGVTERFSKYQFTPDQELLLYCELDNFVSERSKDGKGFETQLQGSYEIVDSNGTRVADQSLPMDSHICRNRRRDYFIAYRIYMPQNIGAGSYSLRLTIEDIKGRKFGQSEVAFQIQ